MTLSYTIQDVGCNGGSDGSITVHVTGGVPPYTYTWSTLFTETRVDTFSIISGLPAGTTYWVQVTDSDVPQNGAYSNFLTISEPPVLVIDSESSTDITCSGANDGTITILSSGGSLPHEYSTDGGSTFFSNGGNFTGLSPGNYPVVIRDANGCTVTGSTLVITEPPGLIITSETKTDITCFGLTDGTLTITTTGGTPPIMYSINGGTTYVPNGGIFTGLGAGPYDIAVQDDKGCVTLGSTLVINEPGLLQIDTENSTNVTCNGANDGTVTITASGGIPPYAYSIDGGVNFILNGGIFSGLGPGNYDVAVRDNNACITLGGTQTITEPTAISLDSEIKTDVSCFGGSDGTITIIASQGTPPYEYSIDGGSSYLNNGGIFTGMPAGNYDIAVRDSKACISFGSTLIINEPALLVIVSEASGDISCFGSTDGTITIVAGGGTTPYEYSIDGGINFFANGGLFTGLGAGSYPVAIRDANACTVTGSTLGISEPTNLVIVSETPTSVSCNGGADGSILITLSGGISPYAYSIDGGINFFANGGSFTNLSAGSYPVVVQDANGCQTSGSTIVLTQPTPLNFDAQAKTDVSCFGGTDGTITLTVSGGTPPYQYSIDGGGTYLPNGGIFTGLAAGNYDISVLDNNGCQKAGSTLSVLEPPQLLIDSQTGTDLSCAGSNDGTITIVVSGGAPPYTYSIDGGTSFIGNGGLFVGLLPGNYDVAVRDNNNCDTYGSTISIQEPSAISITSELVTDISCNGANDGQITIIASGGTPPYTYSIDGGSSFFNNGGNFTNLAPGIYDVMVRDQNSCDKAGSTLVINEPLALSITSEAATDNLCFGGNSGSISVVAAGGVSPYSYSIDGGTTYLDNGGNFSGLIAGNYDVAVRDVNGCVVFGSTLSVSDPPLLVIDSENATGITCSGGNDGGISIAASGGTPPYSFSIDGGTNFINNGGIFSSLTAGNYDVAVRDVNNCIETGSTLTIFEPPAISIDAEVAVDISCNGLNDGSISISASGGTGPYEYSIDGGGTYVANGGIFLNLPGGNYDVSVRDNNGCIRNGSTLTIDEPTALVIDSEIAFPVLCFGGADGSINISTSGGTPPYVYSVDGGSVFVSNGGIFTGLPAGNYDVAVRDDRGCTVPGSTLIVTEPPLLTMLIDTVKASCNSFTNDGSITITPGGGTPSYSYSIDNGTTWQANPLFTSLFAGSYTVVLRDQNSCTLTRDILLESTYTVTANAGEDKNICPGGQTTLDGSGGSGFLWQPATGLSATNIPVPDAFPSSTTTYYLTVTQGVCSDVDSVTVVVFDVPELNAGKDTSIFKGTSVTLTASSGFNTYVWAPATGLSGTNGKSVVATPANDIIYTVVGTTTEGCTAMDSVAVTILNEIEIPSGFTPNNDGYNDTWVIDNAWLFPNITVEVVNRLGQRVFYSRGYGNGIEWDGTYNGKTAPYGTYYFVILLNDGRGMPPITGPVTIVR